MSRPPLNRLVLISLLVVIAWGLTVAAMGSPLVQRAEKHLLDMRFQARQWLIERGWASPVPIDPSIVLVVIDDASREAIDEPPQLWMHDFIHSGLALLRAGATVVGLDFIVLKSPPIDRLTDGQKADLVELAALEADASRSGRGGMVFITGMELDDRGGVKLSMPQREEIRGVIGDPNFAIANLTRDEDRWFRAQFLLPLNAFEHRNDLKGWDFFGPLLAQRARGAAIEDQAGAHVRFGEVDVPVLSQGDKRLLVNFAGFNAFPRVSWKEVRAMSEAQLQARFRGRIVLIGVGSRQDQDIVETPLGQRAVERVPSGLDKSFFEEITNRSMLGVEAQAYVVNTLLTGAWLHRSPRWVTQVAMLTICMIAGLLAHHLRPLPDAAAAFAIVLLWAAISFALFAWRGVVVETAVALPAALLASGFVALERFIAVRRLFGRYVSTVVADELLGDASKETLGATGRRHVTVLFSDINGFSTICEQRSSDEVIRMLNEYFKAMVASVERHGGWLKQFVGDEIMAVYGVPRPLPRAAQAAVQTALDMVEALRLGRERGSEGFFEVKIGVHSGEVIVGNVGTESRAERAVVGDDVNLGARIMTLAKPLGVEVLISEATYLEVKDMPGVAFIDRGEHEVKGRVRRIRVYEARRLET